MPSCLIIAESEVVRKVASTIIETLEYTVHATGNADEAIRVCEKKMPEVILLDWRFSDCDSHEVLRKLRLVNKSKQPYIIYCATENDPLDISQAMSAGADDYLLKPFDRAGVESKFNIIPLETH